MRFPWQRNKTSSTGARVPEEVEQYYESTRKERVGMAWLLSFGMLILTLIIAALLFFGGRWVYREFISNDTEPAPVSEQQGGAEQSPAGDIPTEDGQDGTAGEGATDSNQTDDPVTLPSDGGVDGNGGANGSGNGSVPDQPVPAPTQTPRTGPSEIPRTGPTE